MMRAWSFKPIWAHCVVHENKREENRSRAMHYRGPVLLHSAGRLPRADHQLAAAAASRMAGRPLDIPPQTELPERALVGVARVVGCRWYDFEDGPGEEVEIYRRTLVRIHGWRIAGCHVVELADVEALPAVPMTGFLGLWRVDPARLGEHWAAYEAAWRARGG